MMDKLKDVPEIYKDAYNIGRIRGILIGYKARGINARDALKEISNIIEEKPNG